MGGTAGGADLDCLPARGPYGNVAHMTARLRRGLRLAIPAACCAAFAVGLTAQGACALLFPGSGGGSSVVSPPTTVALATRYVLVSVGAQPLPRVVRQDPDGTVARIFADTLTLTPGGTDASGTFDEITVLGVIHPGQTEGVTRTTASGIAYTRQSYNAVQFATLAGSPPPAPGTSSFGGTVVTRTGGTAIQVYVGTNSFYYESR